MFEYASGIAASHPGGAPTLLAVDLDAGHAARRQHDTRWL
jgi:hypothetical protein